MRTSEVFPSKYLKAADLQGRRVRVVIASIRMEDINHDMKPIMYFQGAQKGMVLNKTNANAVAMFYGEEMDDWTGRTVELFEATVDYQGKQTQAIRLRVIPDAAWSAAHAPAQPPQPTPAQPQPLVTAETLDDDIPF